MSEIATPVAQSHTLGAVMPFGDQRVAAFLPAIVFAKTLPTNSSRGNGAGYIGMLSYLNEKPETDESSKAMQAQCELDKAMAQEEDHRLERTTPTACMILRN